MTEEENMNDTRNRQYDRIALVAYNLGISVRAAKNLAGVPPDVRCPSLAQLLARPCLFCGERHELRVYMECSGTHTGLAYRVA